MKILYDYKIFYEQKYGGASRYFVELISALNSLDHQTLILAPIHINSHLNEKDIKKIYGVKVKNKKIFGKFYEIVNQFINKHLISFFKPQLIHSTYYNDFNKKNTLPTVLTVYDLIHEKYSEMYSNEKNYLPKKNAVYNVDHIICISNNTKKDLIKYYKVEEEKITVIYLAASKNILNPELKKKNYFLYVGNRRRYKNFKTLVKAFSNGKFYKDYYLYCLGGGQFLKEEIEFFKSNKVPLDRVIYLDTNDQDIEKIYINAKALIYPSVYEGFGLPILEAMSFGCPVISSNASCLPEVYGDAALSFDPYDHDALQSKIYELIHNKNLSSELIYKGFEQTKKFSWEKCAKETLSVYKKIIK